MRTVSTNHGSVFIEVDGSLLSGLSLDATGQIIDRFTISKANPVEQVPVVSPWQNVKPTVKPDMRTFGESVSNHVFGTWLGR